jgi:HSP20 family molecular chaperone IbpA
MNTQELTPRDKQEVAGEEQVRPGRYYVPDVDIFESADGLWLCADMPGVETDKVSVEFDDGLLTIRGEVSLNAYEGLAPVYSEYRVGHFLRRFNMPNSYLYDAGKISAKLKDGVLEVHIPKAESAKPRRVTVTAS